MGKYLSASMCKYMKVPTESLGLLRKNFEFFRSEPSTPRTPELNHLYSQYLKKT